MAIEQSLPARTGWPLHHLLTGSLRAESQCRERIRAHVNHHAQERREGQRDGKQDKGQVRDELRHVVGEDVGEKPAMFWKIARPSSTALTMLAKLSSSRIMSAASLADIGAGDPHRRPDVGALDAGRR